MKKPSSSPRFSEFPKHATILFILLFAFFPFYLMLIISLKDNAQFLQNLWLPAPPFHWSNWIKGWNAVGGYVTNTIIMATISVTGMLIFALFSAFTFARSNTRLSKIIYSALIILLMIPGVSNLVPLFLTVKKLGLLNSIWSVIIVSIAGGQITCMFVLRNFIAQMPEGLFEAAEIDGASPLQQIIHIVVPMSGPILSTLAILKFVGVWNSYIQPLIFLRDERLFTVAVGLARLEGEHTKLWGPLMAGYAISAIPLILIFLFTMRLFVSGMGSGAIKA